MSDDSHNPRTQIQPFPDRPRGLGGDDDDGGDDDGNGDDPKKPVHPKHLARVLEDIAARIRKYPSLIALYELGGAGLDDLDAAKREQGFRALARLLTGDWRADWAFVGIANDWLAMSVPECVLLGELAGAFASQNFWPMREAMGALFDRLPADQSAELAADVSRHAAGLVGRKASEQATPQAQSARLQVLADTFGRLSDGQQLAIVDLVTAVNAPDGRRRNDMRTALRRFVETDGVLSLDDVTYLVTAGAAYLALWAEQGRRPVKGRHARPASATETVEATS